VDDRRARRLLWDDVRFAKERLSRQPSADLNVPLLGFDVHLTREELEGSRAAGGGADGPGDAGRDPVGEAARGPAGRRVPGGRVEPDAAGGHAVAQGVGRAAGGDRLAGAGGRRGQPARRRGRSARPPDAVAGPAPGRSNRTVRLSGWRQTCRVGGLPGAPTVAGPTPPGRPRRPTRRPLPVPTLRPAAGVRAGRSRVDADGAGRSGVRPRVTGSTPVSAPPGYPAPPPVRPARAGRVCGPAAPVSGQPAPVSGPPGGRCRPGRSTPPGHPGRRGHPAASGRSRRRPAGRSASAGPP
jgi:hypothetical protein